MSNTGPETNQGQGGISPGFNALLADSLNRTAPLFGRRADAFVNDQGEVAYPKLGEGSEDPNVSEGKLSFEGWHLPSPVDIDRSAEETVRLNDPDLANVDPEVFAQEVTRVRNAFWLVESEMADDNKEEK